MNQLRKIREARGLSRRRLAQLADIDAPTYGKAESGRILSPSQLQRVAQAVEWDGDPAQLLEEAHEDARD